MGVRTERLTSNQALERTAARRTFTFQMIKTVLVKATLTLSGGRSARLVRPMKGSLIVLLFAASSAFAEPTVTTDDRLPPDSIELQHEQPPATSTPWQLPKPGDPLFDAAKEAQIKRENEAKSMGNPHLVRAFERGVFKGYQTLSWDRPGERPAKEMKDQFTPNSKLPPDAVELSASAHPDKSDYFPARPKSRPRNIPQDYIAVRVYHRGKLIGWSYLPKDGVTLLHKPN